MTNYKITPAAKRLNKYARTVGAPGRVARNETEKTYVFLPEDGGKSETLGRTHKEAEATLGCLTDPYLCWGNLAGDFGKPVLRLGRYAVHDEVRVTHDVTDTDPGVKAGDVGVITMILDGTENAYCVDTDDVEIWLSAEEIEPA